MEQSEDTPLEGNVPPQKNEENISLEEWTIIEDDDNAKKLLKLRTKISSPESESSENENTSDAEEAHESTIPKPTKQQLDEPATSPEKEESDGVSVISESENEERTEEEKGRIVLYRSVSQGTEELELQNSNNEVTWCVCLLVAFSVLTAIGISLGSYARDSVPKDVDYVTLKMENDRLVEKMKEFVDVKNLLEEIKSGMIVARSPETVAASRGEEKAKPGALNDEGKSNWKKEETNGRENFFPERLQVFLHTICLMLDDIGETRESSRKSLCDTRTFFSDLANLRNSFDRAIEEMDESSGLVNRRFLEDVDFRLDTIRHSLVTDLTRALDNLSSKNEKKVDKIIGRMREKLCLLRNTMPSESKVRQSLETDGEFLGSCEKFDGRKKERRSSETRNESTPPPRNTLGKNNPKCQRSNDLRPNSNDDNSTKSYNRSNGDRHNSRKGKKQNDSKPNSQENEDESCSVLTTPPSKKSSTWKWSKQQKSPHPPLLSKEEVKTPDDSLEKENSARRNKPGFRIDENVDGTLSAKKIWKKNPERDEGKYRKRSSSTDEEKNDNGKRKMKERNSKIRDDLEIPMEASMRHRTKKRFEEAEKKRLNGKNEKEEIGTNGQWQFARSQIRDELRKAESLDNWYFDRMRNRRSSRMDIDESEEQR